MADYYQPLLAFLSGSVQAGFMGPWQMDLVRVGTDPASLLEQLTQAAQRSAPRDAALRAKI